MLVILFSLFSEASRLADDIFYWRCLPWTITVFRPGSPIFVYGEQRKSLVSSSCLSSSSSISDFFLNDFFLFLIFLEVVLAVRVMLWFLLKSSSRIGSDSFSSLSFLGEGVSTVSWPRIVFYLVRVCFSNLSSIKPNTASSRLSMRLSCDFSLSMRLSYSTSANASSMT